MWRLAFNCKGCAKIRGFSVRGFSMIYTKTSALLQSIETELRNLQLWSETAPTPAALASTAPFCFDSMPFAQWLQFVFLPRMWALVDGRLPLPSQISICPMAEHVFQAQGSAAWILINRIADLDELLSGKREQTVARH
jgi:uncharacterized protein YqcC (DUF446 family)